ncbi:hypothetical protein Dimus_027958 [Dionaea muscipula]
MACVMVLAEGRDVGADRVHVGGATMCVAGASHAADYGGGPTGIVTGGDVNSIGVYEVEGMGVGSGLVMRAGDQFSSAIWCGRARGEVVGDWVSPVTLEGDGQGTTSPSLPTVGKGGEPLLGGLLAGGASVATHDFGSRGGGLGGG